MSVLKLSKNDIIRNEDKEDKIKLKRSDLYFDSARVSGWEQANRQSLDILNDYNNRINKSEWLTKEDRAAYRKAIDTYIDTANRLRGINKTFGEGYSEEDEKSWLDSVTSMNKVYDEISGFYDKFGNEREYGQWYKTYTKEQEYKSTLSAEDFDEYSQIGAGVANPDWDSAHAPVDILGWKPLGDGETINNMVTFAEANSANAGNNALRGGIGSGPSSEYTNDIILINQYAKDDEKNIYNYYIGKGDKQKADEYLTYLLDVCTQRQAGEMDLQFNNTPWELLLNTSAGLYTGLQGLGNVGKAVQGEEGYNTSMIQYASNEMLKDNEGAWKVANDLAQTTGNMLPSIGAGALTTMIAGPGAGKIVGSLVTGLSSAGNSYAGMIEEGYGVDQARKYGVMVGTAEAGLSYLFSGISSIGGKVTGNVISKAIDGIDSGIARFFVDYAINSSSEALEEGAQSILDPIFKMIATGEDFEGIDWSEVGYSAMLGALSAGLLEGVPNGAGAIHSNYQTNVQMGGLSNKGAINAFFNGNENGNKGFKGVAEAYKAGKQTVNEMAGYHVNEALEIDPDNSHAQRMQDRLDAGKDVSGYQINRLIEANEQAIKNNREVYEGGDLSSKQTENAKDGTITQPAATGNNASLEPTVKNVGRLRQEAYDRLVELGEKGNTDSAAFAIAWSLCGQELATKYSKALNKSKYASKVIEELRSKYGASEATASTGTAGEVATNSVTENATVKENATEAKFEASEGVVKSATTTAPKATMVDSEGNEVKVKPQRFALTESGEMGVEIEGGKVVAISEVDFGDSDIGLVHQAAVDMSSRVGGFSVDTANVFVRGYDAASGQSAGAYINGWVSAYKFGAMKNPPPLSALAANPKTSQLTEEQRKNAYNFGKAFGNDPVATTKNSEGFVGEYTKRAYTSEQAELLSALPIEALQNAVDSNGALSFNSIGLGGDKATQQKWIDAGLTYTEDGKVYVDENAVLDERDRRKSALKETKKADTVSKTDANKKKGRVIFDGAKYGKTLNERQRASLKALNFIAKALGIDIYVDKLAKGDNGWYDPADRSIHVDLEAGVEAEALMLFTTAHELGHDIRATLPEKFNTLADAVFEEYNKKFGEHTMADLIAAKIDFLKEKGDITEEMTEEEAYDRAFEEVICDCLETMLVDSDAMMALSQNIYAKDKTLWQRIKDFFARLVERIRAEYADAVPDTEEGQRFRDLGEGAERIKRLWEEAIVELSEVDKTTGAGKVKHSYSSIAYSFFGDKTVKVKDFENGSYTETEGYKRYVENCLNNMRQTSENFNEESALREIEDSIAGIVNVAVAMKKAGYDILDNHAKREARDSKDRLLFSSLEPNSDYFTSSDISTICDKRINFAEIYDEIVRREEALGVPVGKRFFNNVDNYFILHKIMADKGLTQPCRQCYVESMRKNLAPMAKAFLKLMQETDPNNTANDQLFSKGKPKPNNTKLREKLLEAIETEEYDITADKLTVEMLTTEDGLAQLKLQAPLIYEAFNSFYGQSKPKMPKSATPFRFGELTALLTDEKGKIKKGLIDKILSTGGFRLQSYSDFQIQNFADVLQVIFEAGTLGLSGHAYTKVPAFLDATKGTNLKRNISIFMYNDGGEWKIDRNDSFPYDLDKIYDIVKSDKQGNTSIIAVSQNEMMAAFIMANDNIGYFIPFHKSGMKMGTVRETVVKEGGREIKGYSGIKDHTRQQTEVWAKNTADHKAFTKVKKGINIYEFWDFDNADNLSREGLIEKNVRAYIDACDEAGYLPKFREYVMNNSKVLNSVLNYAKQLGFVSQNASVDDISFEYKGYRIPYGYYKCLGDFGMFTPDGEASPIERLSLKDYNFDEAVEFFSNAESLRRNEILQQIANGEERERYRNSDMTTAEIAEEVQAKRGEVVDEVLNKNVKHSHKASTKSDYSSDERTTLDKSWEKGYNLYTATDDFYREVPYGARHSFARSLANKTSGMTDGEIRIIYVNGYIFEADGYMRGRILAPYNEKTKKLLEVEESKYDRINDDREIASVWTEAIQNAERGSGSDSGISRRGRSGADDRLLGEASERDSSGDNERVWTNPRTKEDYDEIIKKLREMYGLDAVNHSGDSDIRHSHKPSKKASYAPTFYSHMGKVIDDIKLEKMGSDSLLNHLKNRGVKAEELKWSGIETFLEGKKSVTKAELQEFVAGSQLRVEEEKRSSEIKYTDDQRRQLDSLEEEIHDIWGKIAQKWEALFNEPFPMLDVITGDYPERTLGRMLREKDAAMDKKREIFELVSDIIGNQVAMDNIVAEAREKSPLPKWQGYKLDGGSNYRELVFQLPDSTYSNSAMRGHWGQDAEGVLAHARIQDFDVKGKKMLFVEEIQSDWHNEGHQKGYTTKEYEDAEAVYDKLAEDYANKRRAFNKYVRSSEFRSDPDEVSKKKFDWLRRKMDEAEKRMQAAERDVDALKEKGMGDVPDAPFRSNYHEYVLKRLLRMAAEEGYDSIGWTTADIQSKRWSEDYAEGYRIEYDQDIPKFLRKYGKKWGATVGKERIGEYSEQFEVDLDTMEDSDELLLEEGIKYDGIEVWSMNIPDSMKESVLTEGQALYQHRNSNGMKPRTLLANALETAVSEEERNLLQTYKANIDKINAEQEKLEAVMEELDKIQFRKSLSISGEEMSVATFERRAKAKAEKNGINAEDVQFKLDRSNSKYIAYAVGHGTILEADKTFRSADDNARLKELYAEAKDISTQINTYDRELLRLQAMQPIKDVLKREKAMAAKRATEKAEQRRKESVEKVRESAAKTEAKVKLQKLILKTSKWISYPGKDDVKCPDILRGPYAEFLKGIDLSSKRLLEGGEPTHNDERVANAMNNLANAIERITNSQDPSVDTDKVLDSGYLDLPVEFVGKLREMAENISKMMVGGDYVINRMSATDVKQLSKLIRTLNHAIKEMSTLYANLRFANVEALGDNSMSFLESMGEAKGENAVTDFVAWDNVLPYYAFKRFGEGGESIFEGLMDGQDKLAHLAEKIFDFKDKTWTDKEAKAWGEDTHTIDLPSGNTLTLTTANAMGIYCLSRREQGLQHLLGGGTRVIGIKKGTKKATDSRSTLTQEDVYAIVASLTDRQKQVALAMQKFMSEVCAEWGNEVSMKRFLTKEFTDPNYYPIESNDENLSAKDPQAQQSDLYRLLNISATKPLAPGANNEVIIRNIFDVFIEHASDMAKLNAYGLALLDYMKWANYREKSVNESGQITVRGVHKAMIRTYGDKSWSYVLNLIKDVNGRHNDNGDNTFLMNMMRMQKTASVGNNLRVAFLQFTSYPRASMVLSNKSLALGLTKKPQMEKAKKYCGIALWKSYGFYDTNIARSIEDQLKGTTDIRQKLIEFSMKSPEYADAITWGALWNACEYEVAKTTKNKVGSEEFYQEVGRKLREVVYATQVVDSILTRSQIMRSKSGLTQTATAYMSEPTLTTNIVMDAGFQFQKEKRITGSAKEAWKKTGKVITKAAGNYCLLQLITSIAESLADAWRDDDEEEFLKKFGEAFGENLITNLIPFNKIPIISDIADLLLSFLGVGFVSSDNLSTSWLTQAANTVKAWSEVLGEEFGGEKTSKTVYNAIYQTAKVISSLTGVSVSGAMREVVAVWNNTAGAADPSLKIRQYELTGEENRKALYEAISSGDEKQIAWLEAEYDDQKDIDAAIRKALRENDPRIKEAAEAFINGDITTYNKLRDEIVAEGNFSWELVTDALKAEYNYLKNKAKEGQ